MASGWLYFPRQDLQRLGWAERVALRTPVAMDGAHQYTGVYSKSRVDFSTPLTIQYGVPVIHGSYVKCYVKTEAIVGTNRW